MRVRNDHFAFQLMKSHGIVQKRRWKMNNFNREFYVKRAAYIHARVYTCTHMYKCLNAMHLVKTKIVKVTRRTGNLEIG